MKRTKDGRTLVDEVKRLTRKVQDRDAEIERLKSERAELQGRLAECWPVKGDRDRLLGKLATVATTLSFLSAEDDTGDAVRWSDVERILGAGDG